MWFLIGLVSGAAITALIFWLRSQRISVTWYEWLTGILGLALMLFAIQNFSASLAEFEPAVARRFLLVFGLPAILLLAIASLLPWLRHHRSAKSSLSKTTAPVTDKQALEG